MNIFKNIIPRMHPVREINKKADELLNNRPTGFHPIKEKIYRRECAEILDSYAIYKDRVMKKRILNNSYSPATNRRIEQLRNIANGGVRL